MGNLSMCCDQNNLNIFGLLRNGENDQNNLILKSMTTVKTEKLNIKSLKKKPMGLEDFEIIKFLGKGAFGKVILVRKRKSLKLFAMKMIPKKFERS